MNHINPNKAGSALGAITGGLHFVWSVLVLLGWSQSFTDFVFTIHMIEPVFIALPFDLMRASGLVVLTAFVGYVVGSLFARVWNHLHQ